MLTTPARSEIVPAIEPKMSGVAEIKAVDRRLVSASGGTAPVLEPRDTQIRKFKMKSKTTAKKRP
jgi:hypothetical protein